MVGTVVDGFVGAVVPGRVAGAVVVFVEAVLSGRVAGAVVVFDDAVLSAPDVVLVSDCFAGSVLSGMVAVCSVGTSVTEVPEGSEPGSSFFVSLPAVSSDPEEECVSMLSVRCSK